MNYIYIENTNFIYLHTKMCKCYICSTVWWKYICSTLVLFGGKMLENMFCSQVKIAIISIIFFFSSCFCKTVFSSNYLGLLATIISISILPYVLEVTDVALLPLLRAIRMVRSCLFGYI